MVKERYASLMDALKEPVRVPGKCRTRGRRVVNVMAGPFSWPLLQLRWPAERGPPPCDCPVDCLTCNRALTSAGSSPRYRAQ